MKRGGLKRTLHPSRGNVVSLRRSPISKASDAQREKCSRAPCVVCGRVPSVDDDGRLIDEPNDPMHLCPRAWGGCDSPDCCVAGCRGDHEDHEAGRLDLLPYLIAHGCTVEIQHALGPGHFNGDLVALLQRLTKERWEPVKETEG